MAVIFDLDYTLLNTAKFKKALAEALGMDIKEFGNSYREHFKNKGVNYNLAEHLEILNKNNDATRGRIKEIWQNLDKYLSEAAEEILREFKKRDNKLIMLSLGDIGWQKMKIKNLSIKKYFTEIIFEEVDKTKSLEKLRELTKGEKITIVNDNAKELEKMQAILGGGKCETYLIKGPYSEKEESAVILERLKEKLFSKKKEPARKYKPNLELNNRTI